MNSDKRQNWPISGINISVTKIVMLKDKNKTGCASGFFFRDGERKFLITNRHVIVDEEIQHSPDSLIINVHKSITDYSDNNEIIINLYKDNEPLWIECGKCGDEYIDVVLIPLTTETILTINLFNRSLINFFSKENFFKDVDISTFSDVITVGYPLGFSDEYNNLPVYRKGMISSSYPVHFNNQPYFLIDSNLHEGTSGSPVINSSNNLLTRDGRAFHSDFAYLLGIHSAEHLIGENPLGLNVVWYPSVIINALDKTENK